MPLALSSKVSAHECRVTKQSADQNGANCRLNRKFFLALPPNPAQGLTFLLLLLSVL